CGSYECERGRQNSNRKKLYWTRPEYEVQTSIRYYNENRDLVRAKQKAAYRAKVDHEVKDGWSTSKLNLEVARRVFLDEGYTLLSKEYINNSTKMEVLCPKGHNWSVSLHSFKD